MFYNPCSIENIKQGKNFQNAMLEKKIIEIKCII